MLRIAANKAASAPSAPAPCVFEHRLLIADANARGETSAECERCGMEIPQGPYAPDERLRLFGADRTFVFGRPADGPSPAEIANPMSPEDVAADTLATAAEAAVVRSRDKLAAAGRALETAMSRRSWMSGEPNGDVDGASAAVTTAREELDEADEAARKALVHRSRQQQIRSDRLWRWMQKHPSEW